jgi:hypothetical protein
MARSVGQSANLSPRTAVRTMSSWPKRSDISSSAPPGSEGEPEWGEWASTGASCAASSRAPESEDIAPGVEGTRGRGAGHVGALTQQLCLLWAMRLSPLVAQPRVVAFGRAWPCLRLSLA